MNSVGFKVELNENRDPDALVMVIDDETGERRPMTRADLHAIDRQIDSAWRKFCFENDPKNHRLPYETETSESKQQQTSCLITYNAYEYYSR